MRATLIILTYQVLKRCAFLAIVCYLSGALGIYLYRVFSSHRSFPAGDEFDPGQMLGALIAGLEGPSGIVAALVLIGASISFAFLRKRWIALFLSAASTTYLTASGMNFWHH